MTQYFRFYTAAVSFIVVFGGLLSPILEVKLGLGGNSILPSNAPGMTECSNVWNLPIHNQIFYGLRREQVCACCELASRSINSVFNSAMWGTLIT